MIGIDFSLQNFALLLIINSLWCAGIYCLTQYSYGEDQRVYENGGYAINQPIVDKAPLWFIKAALIDLIGEWLTNPVCGCLTCMSSLHSLIYFVAFNVDSFQFILWIPYIICLAGINHLLHKIIG